MRRSLVTMGTCDGVHRGHQRLVRWTLKRARALGLDTTVILFDRPPRFFFRPELAVPLLTTADERAAILRGMGIDRVIVLHFDRKLASTGHQAFFDHFLLGECRAGGIFVGPDFAFGRGRLGDIDWLREACAARGVVFGILPMVRAGHAKVSSSRIRELLLAGDVAAAARLLGRAHFVTGRVAHGRGFGARIGVPTANIEVPRLKLLPMGVYRVRVSGPRAFGGGRIGVCNVGTRPTVTGSSEVHVEAHVPGWRGRIYGKKLTVEFLRRLRGERKFPSLEALKARIAKDIAAARRA